MEAIESWIADRKDFFFEMLRRSTGPLLKVRELHPPLNGEQINP